MKQCRAALLAALFFTALACQDGQRASVPAHLQGVWKSSHPKYADRFLIITQENIIFGIGGGQSESHSITSVKQVLEEDRILYTISYVSAEGQIYRLAVIHNPIEKGTIRLKNQRQVAWWREKPRSDPPR